MLTVKPLPDFTEWLDGIRDKLTVMRLRKRLRKVTLGNKSTQQADIASAIALSKTLEGN